MQPQAYESDARDLRMILLGDCTVTRDLAKFREPNFLSLVQNLRGADVAIANAEILFHEYEGHPSWNHGGTHMAADPRFIESLRWLGVSMVSTANNHSFDYGIEGVEAMIANLDKHAMVHAGTGRNLSEASAPGYLDTPKGRIALISVTATLPANGAYAADPRGLDRGRPGANVLRHHITYTVPKPALDALRAISSGLGFEARKKKLSPTRNPGLVPDTDTHFQFLNTHFDPYPSFANANFQLGDDFKVSTTPHQADIDRNIRWIRNACYFADWVVVSVHCHNAGRRIEEPPEFIRTFARAAIDAGAHVVVGHGPHHSYQGCRGIEIYQERPILYGLGTFLDQMSIKWTPADAYERYGLLDQPSATPADFNRIRSGQNIRNATDFQMERMYAGHLPSEHPGEDHSAYSSIEWRDGRCASIHIHPVTIDGQRPSHGTTGRPMQATGAIARDIVDRFRQISAPFGTEVSIEEYDEVVTGVIRLV